MKAIDRKVWRDLWGMRSQVAAIALVIACGVAMFIMAQATLDALMLTRATFYHEQRFGDVFAGLKRAPAHLEGRIREIPGVEVVAPRVVAAVNLDVEGFDEPVQGLIQSIPDAGPAPLNGLHLRRGRLPDAYRDDEVVVNEVFADAHGFEPGDALHAVVNGRRKRLTVVGVALSPEWVYQIGPGSIFPDFERFGVLWMRRSPLATAYDMAGAFNDVSLSLAPEARLEDVLERLDALIEPYGGLGAYGREDQVSHRFLNEEFKQLEQMATVYPFIFLGVAAFLLNVVVSRLVSTQREQVALLKAFGYGNVDVGLHYLKLVLAIVLLGVVVGIALGAWLGREMAEMYMLFYRFPSLHFELSAPVIVVASVVSAAAAVAGTLFAVRRAAALPPAEAMRPEPPAHYHVSVVERVGLRRWLAQPTRMIVRHLERRPLKAFLSVCGIALACAIVVMGSFFSDALDFMLDVQFELASREDMTVSFVEPTSRRALYELESLPGVVHGEPFRAVPVRIRHEHRSYRAAVEGYPAGARLHRLLDADLNPVAVPEEGLLLTEYLGRYLRVAPGDTVVLSVLEGSRPTHAVPVAGFVEQYVGVGAYMEIGALNRLLHEGPVVSGVYLATDPDEADETFAALKARPRVAGTVVTQDARDQLYETFGQNMLVFAFFITFFAGAIAFGVVYNSARIALSERSRELASLRILGFTRGEIAYILLGELAVLTGLAIPLGFALGWSLAVAVADALQTDLFRIPFVMEPGTYAFASTVILGSALLSGLIVYRRLVHLDLIAVLKTRE